MITFEGNKQALKPAKLLEAKARNIYPHISTSRLRTQIGYEGADPEFFKRIKSSYSLMRKMIKQSDDYYSAIVYALSEGKVGNCTEDAMFTELLGKINGQKNIYTGSIGIERNGESKFLDHAIAFITDQPIESGKRNYFKNKDAIVIDPWLGITDFAGNYFAKLKSTYRKIFMHSKNKIFGTFTNDKLAMELLRSEAKTPKEFNTLKKDCCPKTRLSIIPFIDSSLNQEKINELKTFFPELIIKSFKRISIPNKKAKIISMKKD